MDSIAWTSRLGTMARMHWHDAKRRYLAATKPALPLSGYPAIGFATPHLAALSDSELSEVNALLPWRCFTVDDKGRRLGNRAWPGKREEPQAIPDRRIGIMAEAFPAARHVLEVGCFEGVHTVGLCRRFPQVTAIDARASNVVKTIVRCHLYGHSPEVSVCDVETQQVPESDVVHHVGVLYHLLDPVGHLERLAPRVRQGLMLDSHVARDDQITGEVGGVRFREVAEVGALDAFSGVKAASRWLHLEDLTRILRRIGFGSVDLIERREERNGLRVLLIAKR